MWSIVQRNRKRKQTRKTASQKHPTRRGRFHALWHFEKLNCYILNNFIEHSEKLNGKLIN